MKELNQMSLWKQVTQWVEQWLVSPGRNDCDLRIRSEPYSTTWQKEEEYLLKPQNELVRLHQQ